MAKPFFKWPGGKTNLVPQLLPLLPTGADKLRHVEPFLGGGALFFAREPQSALLADVNLVLVETYQLLQSSYDHLLKKLRRLVNSHSEELYYKRRTVFNASATSNWERAILFLYLNKTCFNGLYRVNADGEFNVPSGMYAKIAVDKDALLAAHNCLNRLVTIHNMDFMHTADFVDRNDFVYLDPPYHGKNSFRSYAADGFDDKDQYRLARAFHMMDKHGAKIMLSTSDTPLIRDLYKGLDFTSVSAKRSVAANGDKRKQVSELVIRNYK